MATQPGGDIADFIHDGFRYYSLHSYSNHSVGVAPLGEVQWALDAENPNDIYGIVADEHHAIVVREEGNPLRIWPDGSYEELILPENTYYGATCMDPSGNTIMLAGGSGIVHVLRFAPNVGAPYEILFTGEYIEDLLVDTSGWPAFEGTACDGRWLVVSSYGSVDGKTTIHLYGFDLTDMPQPGGGAKWSLVLPTGIDFDNGTWGMRSTTERLLVFSKQLFPFGDGSDTVSGGIYLTGPWSSAPTEVWRAEFAARDSASWSLKDAYLTDEAVVIANGQYAAEGPDDGAAVGRVHSLVDGSLVAELLIPSGGGDGWAVAVKDGIIGLAFQAGAPT